MSTSQGGLLDVEDEGAAMATMVDLVNRAVDIALGKQDITRNSPEVMEYLRSVGVGSYQNWCAAFVYWCFQKAAGELGVPNPTVKRGGVAFQWANAVDSHGKYPFLRGKSAGPSTIRRGQLFVYFTSPTCQTGHIGFVVGPKDDRTFETVEGNTNPAGAMDGGGVHLRTRTFAEIANQWGGFIDFAGLAAHAELPAAPIAAGDATAPTQPPAAPPEVASTVTAPESRPARARRGAREWIATVPDVVGQQSPEAREAAFWEEFQSGNYPSFVNQFAEVVLTDAAGRRATLQVSVDLVAIGTDDDWLRFPLSGYMASRVAATFGCFLPTNKVVLETYRQAEIKLVAHLFECQQAYGGRYQRSNAATVAHEDLLQRRVPCEDGQRLSGVAGKLDPWVRGKHHGACSIADRHPGVLVSGHMKEVIVSHEDLTRRLAFWGLFTAAGKPLQASFGCPHGPGYSDYSHGVRLVKADVDLDGQTMSYAELITDPAYAGLVLSGGAACPKASYPDPPSRYYMGF